MASISMDKEQIAKLLLEDLKDLRKKLRARDEELKTRKQRLQVLKEKYSNEQYHLDADLNLISTQLRKHVVVERKITVIPRNAWNEPDGIRFKIISITKLGDEVIDETLQNTVEYFRFHGVLCHRNGGIYVTLNTPNLCSDEEWEAMQYGEIAEKFFHKAE